MRLQRLEVSWRQVVLIPSAWTVFLHKGRRYEKQSDGRWLLVRDRLVA